MCPQRTFAPAFCQVRANLRGCHGLRSDKCGLWRLGLPARIRTSTLSLTKGLTCSKINDFAGVNDGIAALINGHPPE